MKFFSVTSARRRLGHLIDMAQTDPIRITRRGCGVAIVMSPGEFRRMTEAGRGKANPAVERLHAESARRWATVYAALAR